MAVLYTKQKIFTNSFKEELFANSESLPFQESTVWNFNPNSNRVDHNKRKSKFKFIERNYLPENYTKNILTLVNIYDPKSKDLNLSHTESNLIFYEKGDHFRELHKDGSLKYKKRLYSAITLLEYSEDAIGADLFLQNTDPDDPILVNSNLKVYETIVFSSSTKHLISDLLSGTRVSLISWFGIQ